MTYTTILGICNDGKRNKAVRACKDLIDDDTNEVFIPYTSLRNDTNPIIMEIRDSNVQTALNLNEIINFITDIPEYYNDVLVISENRKNTILKLLKLD